MPTLVVEDGTGIAGANSYIDEVYLISYSDDRGLSIPSTTLQQQQYLLKAMDYLSWFDGNWNGTKTNDANALAWPRQDVVINCVVFDENSIPEQLKKAQAQLVVEQQLGTILFPRPRTSTIEGLVSQKTVGPLTKKFAFTGRGIANPYQPILVMSVFVFLEPLLLNTRRFLNTVRL